MENIYALAAVTRRRLMANGMNRQDASTKVSLALNSSEDYQSAVKALGAL